MLVHYVLLQVSVKKAGSFINYFMLMTFGKLIFFLSIVMFGFVTWSGGFYGIQSPHKDFRRFQADLDNGRHVFIVDVDSSQEDIMNQVELDHPLLVPAGTGTATPRWVIMGQQNFKDITTTTFP